MSRNLPGVKFNVGPIVRQKSRKQTQKFITAANTHTAEIHQTYRRRKSKTHARASLGMTETVLEYVTRRKC